MTAALAGCGDLPPIRLQLGSGVGVSQNFDGVIAADEPEAVLAARDILLARGNAMDAAVALGFTLAVTLPSSAGLGGGGACLVYDADSADTQALDFTIRAAKDDRARYRAAIPALARGLFALHAKYGRLPWAQIVAPAENLARFGHPVSRAFAGDLARDGGALTNDSAALTNFMTARRQMVQAGEVLKQIDLAATLSRLRARGPGDLNTGAVGREMEEAIAAAGAAVTAEDMRAAVPRWVAPLRVDQGSTRIFALPGDVGSGDFAAALAAAAPPSNDKTEVGATGFVVADAAGNVVACGLSMGRPFGLGIMPKGTGFLLAPAPDASGPAPQLAPVIALNRTTKSIAFAAASVGTGLINTLRCAFDERTQSSVCQVQSDPRGAGYALMLNPKEE